MKSPRKILDLFGCLMGFMLFVFGRETDPADLKKKFLFCLGTCFYCYNHMR